MKKFIIALLTSFLVFIYSSSGQVLAHSALESSTPAKGEVVTDKLSTITLTFTTEVKKGSLFYVTNEQGEKLTPSFTYSGKELTGAFDSPLKSGEYTLTWEVVGADSHPVTGSYHFTVEQQTANDENNQKEENTQQPSDNEQPNNEEPTNQQEQNNQQDDTANSAEGTSNQSSMMPIIVIVLVVLGAASFIWMIRRNKTS